MKRLGFSGTRNGMNNMQREFVASLDVAEFGSLRFLVGERYEREQKEMAEKIAALKSSFSFTETEQRLLSKNERIEVIKSLRARLGLGLAEAKRLFDAVQS